MLHHILMVSSYQFLKKLIACYTSLTYCLQYLDYAVVELTIHSVLELWLTHLFANFSILFHFDINICNFNSSYLPSYYLL